MEKKTIKRLQVKVTYYVRLGGVEVKEDVYKGLTKAYTENNGVVEDFIRVGDSLVLDENGSEAMEWLVNNISERDSYETEYEIEELEE